MALKDSSKEYGDIINLPHPESRKHPRMSMHDRAAQFSPFAALTGHGAAIAETARLTDNKMELDENYKASLDEKLMIIMAKQKEKPMVVITFFKKDERKAGGAYEIVEGRIRKVDLYERIIEMEDRQQIPIDDMTAIESEGLTDAGIIMP